MDEIDEKRLEAAARRGMQQIFKNRGLPSPRDELIAAHDLWLSTHGEYLNLRAVRIAEQALKGPYTHKYKGVAVTKDQFVQLMNAEGFTWPQDAAA